MELSKELQEVKSTIGNLADEKEKYEEELQKLKEQAKNLEKMEKV